MYESKYLMNNTDAFFARHPEISEEVKALTKDEMLDDDKELFGFVMSYIFM